MVNQDLHSRSVAGDSGHGTMAVTPKDKLIDSNEKLVGAMGGINENVSAENLSDVECKEDDPLLEFNDENVTIPQIPQITPQKEALLLGVDHSMSFKGSPSIMPRA